jgi:hypothetical protein
MVKTLHTHIVQEQGCSALFMRKVGVQSFDHTLSDTLAALEGCAAVELASWPAWKHLSMKWAL